MPTDLARGKNPSTRIVLYTLLIIFNASIWLLLIAFRWQVSLRAREIAYFDRQLFPIHAYPVPLAAIYIACTLLTLTSILVVVIDRTSMAARDRLRALLGQILESLDIGVIVLDRSGQLIQANESGRRLLPGLCSASPKAHFRQLLRDHPRVQEILAAALESGNYTKEVEHNLGSLEEPLIVRITTVPLKDLNKRVIGTLLLINDVHEIVLMQRRMRTAERLSALGTLAAALAHEIRNPLEAVNLNLELLGRDVEKQAAQPDGSKMLKYVKIIESEISRLAQIVDNFLSFARPAAAEVKSVSLGKILKEVVDLLQNQASKQKVDLALENHAEWDVVEGSADQLKQVFLNLAINGLHAMPDGGKLMIRVEPSLRASPSSDGMIAVSIQDTGEGIPPEKMEHIFDPFFSTRPHGTGLGLSIAHRIIEAHRGYIGVDSKVGQGTRFTVELPSRSPKIQES